MNTRIVLAWGLLATLATLGTAGCKQERGRQEAQPAPVRQQAAMPPPVPPWRAAPPIQPTPPPPTPPPPLPPPAHSQAPPNPQPAPAPPVRPAPQSPDAGLPAPPRPSNSYESYMLVFVPMKQRDAQVRLRLAAGNARLVQITQPAYRKFRRSGELYQDPELEYRMAAVWEEMRQNAVRMDDHFHHVCDAAAVICPSAAELHRLFGLYLLTRAEAMPRSERGHLDPIMVVEYPRLLRQAEAYYVQAQVEEKRLLSGY